MPAKLIIGSKALPVRVLACLLSVALVVSLCPLQGWSDEAMTASDQVTKNVLLEENPAAPQLMKSVPMEEEPEAPQLTKAVPLAAEPDPEPERPEAPTQDSVAKTAKVTFVVSDEPTASWADPENVAVSEGSDPATADRTVEVRAGEPLGGFVPPTPVSSDDSLVFEGWQTEDFTTYTADELSKLTPQDGSVFFAVFSSAPTDGGGQRDEEGLIASGYNGTCKWEIRGTSPAGTLTIYAGKLSTNMSPGWESYGGQIANVVIKPKVALQGINGGLFRSCSNLTSITGLDNLDISQVTSLDSMFNGCKSLTSLVLPSTWDVSRVERMNFMFQNCQSLTSLELPSTWNVSNLKSMYYMFSGCSSLVSLSGLTSWDTSNVEDMLGMFTDCTNLASINLSSLNTSSVARMNAMFSKCISLTSVGGISSWNTSRLTSTWMMFEGCTSLTSLDLSSWNTGSLESMGRMFFGCSNLASVGDLSSWNTSSVTSMQRAFKGCSNLVSVGSLSSWNTSSVTTMEELFNGCSNLTSVGDLSFWNTSSVTDMNYMFNGCSSLASVGELSSWNTSSVTDMSAMFSGCSSLVSVGDLSSWNISSVVKMNYMFNGCSSLVSANLSSWNASNVTDMYAVFQNCSSLTSLNLSSWSIPSVTSISRLFSGCSNLASVNLSSWSMPSVKYMDSVFANCESLASLDLSSWNTSNVVNMDSMFNGCSSLTTLDWPSLSTSNVTQMVSMFSGCNSLKIVPSTFTFGRLSTAGSHIFKVTAGGPVVTTYNGDDQNVKNYDWPSAGRALKGLSLTGTVSVSGNASTISQTLTPSVEIGIACRNAQQVFTWYRGTSVNDANPTYVSTGATYTTTNADAGKYIICKMTDGLGAYTGVLTSTGVGPVKGSFTAAVSLSGTAKVDSTLTAIVSNPASGVVPFTYRWYRSSSGTDAGTLVATTSTNSYELQDADKGSYISCEVSVTDTAAWTGSARSGWSACVLKDFSASVSVTGNLLTGEPLTASVSGNAGGEALSYQWYRSTSPSGDGSAIYGATAAAYQQTDADRNQYLSCQVSVANTNVWTGTARSGWYGPSLTTFSAVASVSGSAVVGQDLAIGVFNPNAPSYSYQWQSADVANGTWTNIFNATGDSYRLGAGDFGRVVRCVVTATAAGYTGYVVSSATAVVKGVLAGTASVSGNLYANQKLTASVQGFSPGATAEYRWYTATDAAGANKTWIASGASAELDLSQFAQTKVVGKYVVCEVSDSSYAYVGTVSSSAVGPVGIAWGTCGPNVGGCVWTIDAAGAMTIAPAADGAGKLSELSWNSVPWSSYAAQVTSARVESGVKAGASLSNMFSLCSKMTAVDLSGLDASGATDLSSMFYACSSLATVNGLGVLNATTPANLGSMFYGCSSLASIDLSGFPAGTATDLSAMFWGCSTLSALRLPSGFVGDSCTTVVNMFRGCNALATIPAEFGFGGNPSIQTAGCFTATGSYNAGNLLTTTYLGDDVRVASYDWKGSNRSLSTWKLSGEASIMGGDDPIADNELTASVTFTGPAAGLEDGATYQWFTANSADDANPVAIDKATGAAYSPRKADIGKFLVCLVSAPSGSGAQGTLRAVTAKAVRAPQVWATVPSRTQVYADSEGRVSVPTTSAYALGALDSEGKATEGDIQLVGVTLTLGDSAYPGGSWTLGTPGGDKTKASTFIENKTFAMPGTECRVTDAPAIAPGSKLPLEWEASFKNDIGPKLTSLLTAADGEGAHYGDVEFKVAWKPRA